MLMTTQILNTNHINIIALLFNRKQMHIKTPV